MTPTSEFEKYVPADPFFVYVAGPMSKGVAIDNIKQALEAANELLLAGLVPIVPQMTFFWRWLYPPATSRSVADYDTWLKYDFAFLKDVSRTILRLPGESFGADQEVEYMRWLGRPVFYCTDDVIEFAKRCQTPSGWRAPRRLGA